MKNQKIGKQGKEGDGKKERKKRKMGLLCCLFSCPEAIAS